MGGSRSEKASASGKRIVPLRPGGGPAAAPSRREMNKRRRRRQILRGARECFEAREIEAVSMDEIAARARVARGTLFNYFPGKAEIVRALVGETVDGFCRIVEAMNARHATVEARLDAAFGEAASRILASAELTRRILRPKNRQWGSALDDLASANRVIEAFTRTFTTATDAPPDRRDVSARDLAEIAVSAFSGLAEIWRLDPSYPLRRKVRLAARLVAELARASPTAEGRRRA